MPSSPGGCLRSVVAGLLALVFVILLPASLLLFNVDSKLLHPGPYKDAMARQDVYRRLPALVAEQLAYVPDSAPSEGGSAGDAAGAEPPGQTFVATIILHASEPLTACLMADLGSDAYTYLAASSRPATSAETEAVKACLRRTGVPEALADSHDGMPIFFWMLSQKDWLAILTDLLPPEWLQTELESAVDQVYAALEASETPSAITLPMGALKARIAGDEGFDAVVHLIEAQAPCTPDQLALFLQPLGDSPLKDVPVCRPPESLLTLIYPSIRTTLATLAAQIPDRVELKYPAGDGSSRDPLDPARNALRLFRTAVLVALLVPLALLLLVALFGARSLKGLLRWWGVPLMATGLITVSIAVAGFMATRALSDSVLNGAGGHSAVAPGVLQVQVDVVSSIAQGYLSALLVQALAVALIGLGLVVASFFVGRHGATPATRVFALDPPMAGDVAPELTAGDASWTPMSPSR